MPTVLKDRYGPDWPLGFIKVPTPATVVSIMSLVDANNFNAPGTASNSSTAEYSERVHSVYFQAVKPGANNVGLVPTANNVYIVRSGGNKNDPGTIVAMIGPGNNYTVTMTSQVRNGFSPYRYYLDVDTANDGALVTALIE